MALIQQGQEERLTAPVPFRRFVAEARSSIRKAEDRAFFTQMLGEVTERHIAVLRDQILDL